MVMYRRNFVPGGTYFFTVTLTDRRASTLVQYVDEPRAACRSVTTARGISTVAICVLPDHLHAVWTMADGDANYSSAWSLIKARFSRALAKQIPSITPNALGELGIWQRRFWEHTIRDDRDLENYVNYVHYNPVKHGHAARPIDWPHSSFHHYVRNGLLPSNWTTDANLDVGE